MEGNTLLIALIIGLIVDWFVTDLQYTAFIYWYFKVNLNFKPFNCTLCASFWIGWAWVLGLMLTLNFEPQHLLIPFLSSAFAVLINTYKTK